MLLGEVLTAKGLVSAEEIERARDHQLETGGRLDDCLVELGVISSEQIEQVLNEAPEIPSSLEETGLDPTFLLRHMVKGMYTENLETPSKIARAMGLTNQIVATLLRSAIGQRLAETAGQESHGLGALAEIRYRLSEMGREFAMESLTQNQYFGPAPVTLEDYQAQILRQRITNERIDLASMDEAFKSLVMPDRFVARLGPAINSGTAVLIYGPSGNGKTTISQIIGRIFDNVVYIPYCFEVDGFIFKVFDPSVHEPVESKPESEAHRQLQRDPIDRRWVPCRRPFVETGGELTLEMLDLKFNEIAKFYDVPMHIKAVNGIFLIDDFGRQQAKPEDILNRWIMPLHSRVDYLGMHTGKSFELPFDELVIFSTNLHPSDLIDPAFQRRIAYKLETVAPPEDLFREVFESEARKHSLDVTEAAYQQVLEGIRATRAPLAYFQPKFIIEQVLSSCKFEGTKPEFTPGKIEDALLNLAVAEGEKKGDFSKVNVTRIGDE